MFKRNVNIIQVYIYVMKIIYVYYREKEIK